MNRTTKRVGLTHGRLRSGPLGSTRTRILAAFILLLALSTLASTLLLRTLLLDRLEDRVQSSLVQEVDEFRRLAADGIDPDTGDRFGTLERLFDVYLDRNVPGRDEVWYTFVGGDLYDTTATAGDDRPPVGPVTGSDAERGEIDTEGGGVAYLRVPVNLAGQPQGTFVTTENVDTEREEVTQAVQIAAGVSLGVLAGASLLAFALAGRILAPLRDVTETARAISETDLTRRIDVTGRDEISVLAQTFNEMLDRLDESFGSQRAFVSDAGHELRTPITIIRGHLELLGRQLPERRDTVELLIDELDRMSRIVDDLLTLAKAERDDFLLMEDLDIDVLTEELLSKAEALAPRRWILDEVAAGRISADRQRLTQAMMNLAANAAQHTNVDDRIAIGSALVDGEARLWVADTGSGVPDAEQARIFERFARGASGKRRSEGAGLGLAIVQAIAEAHHGRVVLHSREGDGATFTIRIPADADAAAAAQEGI